MMNSNKDQIVVLTGGFDPLHSGHLSYINSARELGRVVIGLNSDDWLKRKKGSAFMDFKERAEILSNLKSVMMVLPFDDSDDSAGDAITQTKKLFPNNEIIFANGGDRTEFNIPEMEQFKDDPKVTFMFGVGGQNKKNSSSWILNQWKQPSEERNWGKFITYYNTDSVKVKRLVVNPGKSISMQYHNLRSEFWFIESGCGHIYTLDKNEKETLSLKLEKHQYYHVPVSHWHRLENVSDDDLCVVEIQYGTKCTELDIIRFKTKGETNE